MGVGLKELVEHLSRLKEREQERKKALDKAFGNIKQYEMHGVMGLLHYISLLESGEIYLDNNAAEEEAQRLRNKLYEINGKYTKKTTKEVA